METRRLGRTELEVSIFGFGGIVVMDTEQEEANEIVATAVDRGINLFDVGPTYGNAQERLGPALEPYREDVILACKTEPNLTKEEVEEDLRKSLALLRTDYFDIYQLHAVNKPDDIKKALGPGGALEAIVEAKEKGLVRYIGFSSHFEQSALKLIDQFDFDTILFQINWNYWLNEGAGKEVLKTARARDMGKMVIKALAHRKWKDNEEKLYPQCWYKPIFDDRKLASMALRFTLSKSVDVAMSPGDVRMLRLGMDILTDCEKLALKEDELDLLKERARELKPIFPND